MADIRTRLTELPAEPFTALSVHFGMLLGVSDIELLTSSARGKLRLHNAFLHGPGVIWGYSVSFSAGARELAVDIGLAQDSRGRELHLGARMCLGLDAWYEANRNRLGEGDRDVEVDVAVRYRACLDRPVPALAGECDDSPESAYSRVQETVQIDLEEVENRPPTNFLRLRRALGQDIHATLEPDTASISLAALVALDSLDLKPPAYDAPVIVARVTINIVNGRPEIGEGAIDHSVRRVHIPTTLVTELLGAHAPPGPHLDKSSVEWLDDEHLTIKSNAPLFEATLASGVVAHRWDAGAADWLPVATTPSFADGLLQLEFGEAITSGTTVRIIVSGSGPRPVTADVGGRPTPLAGDGVIMEERP